MGKSSRVKGNVTKKKRYGFSDLLKDAGRNFTREGRRESIKTFYGNISEKEYNRKRKNHQKYVAIAGIVFLFLFFPLGILLLVGSLIGYLYYSAKENQ